jgi:hypothetical protein
VAPARPSVVILLSFSQTFPTRLDRNGTYGWQVKLDTDEALSRS